MKRAKLSVHIADVKNVCKSFAVEVAASTKEVKKRLVEIINEVDIYLYPPDLSRNLIKRTLSKRLKRPWVKRKATAGRGILFYIFLNNDYIKIGANYDRQASNY